MYISSFKKLKVRSTVSFWKKPTKIYNSKYFFQMSGESMDTGEKTYGGCEGPDAMYVKLISSDGHEFIGNC